MHSDVAPACGRGHARAASSPSTPTRRRARTRTTPRCSAAGCVVDAVTRVLDGGLRPRLLPEPPARPSRGAERVMGFCYFNNVAAAAAEALAAASRACWWWTSTCTTATARSRSSRTIRACSTCPRTSTRSTREPAAERDGHGQGAWLHGQPAAAGGLRRRRVPRRVSRDRGARRGRRTTRSSCSSPQGSTRTAGTRWRACA